MRRLKIFEAFESNALNNVYQYAKQKVGKENADFFIRELKSTISESYDIPLSQVKDDAFEYLSAKKALQIKKGDFSNPWGVYALKFWFSIEEGFLGVSGVNDSEFISYDQLSGIEVNWIKNERGLTTGTLVPAKLSDLSHGDTIVAYLDDNYDYLSKLSVCRIWIDRDEYFAIQNESDGGTPNSRGWRDWGRYSWSLGTKYSPGNDHKKLHLHKQGTEELKVISDNIYFEQSISNGRISSSDTDLLDYIKKVDFAIILYPDALVDYDSIENIKKSRKEIKSGATAFLTDEEVKKLNIERYVIRSLELYGLSETSIESDFKNLQNLISQMYCDEFILFSINTGHPSLSGINNLISQLKYLIKSEDKKYALLEIKSIIKSYKSESKSYKDRFKGSYERVKRESRFKTKDLIDRLTSISTFMNNSIRNRNVQSIGDILILRQDILSAQSFLHEISESYFSRGLKKIISNYRYNDGDVSDGINICNEEIDKELINNQKGLDILEKYIKNLFR